MARVSFMRDIIMVMITGLAFYQEFYMYCLLAFLCLFYYVFYFLCNVCSIRSGRFTIRALFSCVVCLLSVSLDFM